MIDLNSYRKWEIGNEIRALLLADDELQKMISNHIFPIVAPENIKGNLIVYRRTKYSRDNCKMGVYEDNTNIMLNIVSEDYDDSIHIAEMVDRILIGRFKSSTDYNFTISLEDSDESFEDNKYIQTLILSVK